MATELMRSDPLAFEPTDLDSLARLATMVVRSGLAPSEVRTPEAAAIIIATGRELGLSAMKSLRAIHVIKGRPTLSADLMAGLVKSSPLCKFFRIVEMTPERATFETHRVGEPAPTSYTYSMADAKAAGIAGDMYRKHPAAMLKARCITALARAVYPDLVMGLYDPDELQDAPEPVQVERRVEVVRESEQRSAPPRGRNAGMFRAIEESAPAAVLPELPDPRADLLCLLDEWGQDAVNAYCVASRVPTIDERDVVALGNLLEHLQSDKGARAFARFVDGRRPSVDEPGPDDLPEPIFGGEP